MDRIGDKSNIGSIEIDPEKTFLLSKSLFYGSSLLTGSFALAEIELYKNMLSVSFIFALCMSSSVFSGIWEARGDWKRFLTITTVVFWTFGILFMGLSLFLF